MSRLNLKLNGFAEKDTLFLVDGKRVKFKKNDFGNKVCSVETENPVVTIQVTRFLEINSKFWLLWQLLFFLISIFGIFDARLSKSCYIIDCEFKIYLEKEDTDLIIKFNNYKNQKALELQTDAKFEEIKNVYFEDKKAKKRMKTLKVAKLLTALGIILIAALLVYLLIFKEL